MNTKASPSLIGKQYVYKTKTGWRDRDAKRKWYRYTIQCKVKRINNAEAGWYEAAVEKVIEETNLPSNLQHMRVKIGDVFIIDKKTLSDLIITH
jgi:hypothetical protein